MQELIKANRKEAEESDSSLEVDFRVDMKVLEDPENSDMFNDSQQMMRQSDQEWKEYLENQQITHGMKYLQKEFKKLNREHRQKREEKRNIVRKMQYIKTNTSMLSGREKDAYQKHYNEQTSAFKNVTQRDKERVYLNHQVPNNVNAFAHKPNHQLTYKHSPVATISEEHHTVPRERLYQMPACLLEKNACTIESRIQGKKNHKPSYNSNMRVAEAYYEPREKLQEIKEDTVLPYKLIRENMTKVVKPSNIKKWNQVVQIALDSLEAPKKKKRLKSPKSP